MTLQNLKLFIFILLLCGFAGRVSYGQKSILVNKTKTENVSDVKIFPNPVEDEFRIKIDSDRVGSIAIYNILGKEVSTFRTTQDQTYSVRHLKRGIYIVRIFDRNEQLVKALRMSKT